MTYKSALFCLSVLLFLISCKKDKIEDHMQNGLIAYYPFNGNANDESGNNYNLTVKGAGLTSDRFGSNSKAYSFNGVNSILQIPNLTKAASLTDLTISLWIKPEIITPYIISFAGNNSDANCFSYVGLFESNGDYIMNNGIVTGLDFCVTTQIYNSISNPIGKWSQLTLVQYLENIPGSPLTMFSYSLYYNGTKLNWSIEQASNYNPIPTNLNFGGLIGSGMNSREHFFKGEIDDIRIYNRKLTDAEVLELYNLKY